MRATEAENRRRPRRQQSRILKCYQPCSNASLTMPTTTIDIHPHIIANDAARYPLAPLGGHQSDWSRTRPVSLEQLIAAMDEAGVQKAAIVQASTCYGHDNSYVADAVAAHPDRFTGVFSVDVLAPDAPVICASGVGAASPACGFSRSAAQCPSRRIGWTIRAHIRPGHARASWAFRSVCKCRRRRFRRPSAWPSVFRMCASFSTTARAPNSARGRLTTRPPVCSIWHVTRISTSSSRRASLPNPAAARPRPRLFPAWSRH